MRPVSRRIRVEGPAGVADALRAAASLLSLFPGSFRVPFASKAAALSRPPGFTGGPPPSPTGTGPSVPAPARADERPGDRPGRSPSIVRPSRGRADSARTGRSDPLTMTGRRPTPPRGVRGGAGSARTRLREARDPDQWRPARDPRSEERRVGKGG